MSKRKGRKPEFTALGVRLVAEILGGSEEAVAEFINWRSPDRKQYPQYMSGPELRPLWEARERLPDELVSFIETWCSDDGVRRKQNSVEAKRRKAEERLALQEEEAAAAEAEEDQAWDAAAPAPAEADRSSKPPLQKPQPQCAPRPAFTGPIGPTLTDLLCRGRPRPQTCWNVLGLPPRSTEDEIQRAWREKAKRAHPDQGGSTAAMAELNAARDAALGEARRSE
jgi:hypothetical protein